MSLHLQKEIVGLKKRILSLGTLVEENVGRAVRAVGENDDAVAREVIALDAQIDALEIEVEEECLKILALHQPVAVDLRFIVAVLKMNNDFERIGDLSVNIAERTLAMKEPPPPEFAAHLGLMVNKVCAMVNGSLDSLVNIDAALARRVCASDDAVDTFYREMYANVKNGIAANPEKVDDLLQMLSISRHLERIADHATNIAEDVIYMIEGEIFRHSIKQKK
jgi:phosphate transport system protein